MRVMAPRSVSSAASAGCLSMPASLSGNLTSSKQFGAGSVRFPCVMRQTDGATLRAMAIPKRMDIVRRLRAVREELGYQKGQEYADLLGVGRTRYANWENDRASGNYPAEETMAHLCDLLPGLTMDYIYRGVLDAVPTKLGIRLTMREQGQDPDAAPALAGASAAR